MGFDNIHYERPRVFVTSYTDHDRGGRFAGPPVIAKDWEQAEATLAFYKGMGELHPSLVIDGEFIEEFDDDDVADVGNI